MTLLDTMNDLEKLKLYYNNKKIRVFLLYLQVKYPHILKSLLGSRLYSLWIKKYGKHFRWLFDLETYIENSNDNELKSIYFDLINNPYSYIEKYLPPDYITEIKSQKIISELDTILKNMPKGIASEGIAKIIEVIINYYKEKERFKIEDQTLSLSDLLEGEEEDVVDDIEEDTDVEDEEYIEEEDTENEEDFEEEDTE